MEYVPSLICLSQFPEPGFLRLTLVATLAAALIATVISVMLIYDDPERQGVAAVIVTLGLWSLATWLWPTLLVVWRGLLVLAAVAGGLVAAFGSVVEFTDDTADKRLRRRLVHGLALALLSLTLLLGVLTYFVGVAWLGKIAVWAGSLAGLSATIPAPVWAGSVVGATLLALVFNLAPKAFANVIWASGTTADGSHVWADYRGTGWGRATRKDVYDHYHGRGSWYRVVGFWLGAARLMVVALPALIPLTVVHVTGLHNALSRSGVLLGCALSVISLAIHVWRSR